ncbi:50S ribosomal protein L18 RplR [gut metagenome]|uniref:50S ribosomal protein L18 RplR n=1 Tax=gut metagenome TaxID=749906 RepID=J9GL59_9ZZZZ
METVTGTVKSAGFNTCSLGLFGKTRANELGSGNVATAARNVSELSTHFGFDRRGRDQRTTIVGRNDAGINMQVGTMNRQAIDLLQQNAGTRSTRTTHTALFLVDHFLSPRLLLLGFLDHDDFVDVTDALALIGFGSTIRTDNSSGLTDLLLVSALDHNVSRTRGFALHTGRHLVHDRVRKTEGKVELVALSLGTIAHADELKLLREAFGATLDHIGHESAHRTNISVGFTRFSSLLEMQSTIFFRDSNQRKDMHRHFTLRTLHSDIFSGQRVANALNHVNGNLSNSTHFTLLG